MASTAPARTYVQRPERWACNLEAMIRDDCGRELLGRVANLSDAGFMAECEEKLRIGAVIDVMLPGRGQVRAEVRWALGWRFGAMILPD